MSTVPDMKSCDAEVLLNPPVPPHTRDRPDPSPMEKVKARLLKVEKEMLSTKEDLSVAQVQLEGFRIGYFETKGELAATKAELQTTKAELAELREMVLKCLPTPNCATQCKEEKIEDQVDGRIILPFKGVNFDDNGLIYFVGTAGKKKQFGNPHTLGEMTVTMSCVDPYHGATALRFLNHADMNRNSTKWGSDRWMMVDIGKYRKMIVSQYCLRHGLDMSSHYLVNWKFEGRNDDTSNWTTLLHHINDHQLQGAEYKTACWPIETTEAYRYFRIVTTGVNSSNDERIFCCGIEMYGVLLTT